MKPSFAFRLFVTILLLAGVQSSLHKPASVLPRATQMADGPGCIPTGEGSCPKKARPLLELRERQQVADGSTCIPDGPTACPRGVLAPRT